MDTAFFTHMNWLAIIVATVAYFLIGALWYSALFQKPWIAYNKIDMSGGDSKKGVGGIMLTSFVLTFIIVVCLSILVFRLSLSGPVSGFKLGLMTGVGFAATTISIGYLYLKKLLGLHLIDGGYHVAGHIAAAIILSVWH